MSSHPVDPTRINTKTYNSNNNERINYKIGPEGQFIPNNWLPVKHNYLRQPNTNTNALKLYNLEAEPFNMNENNMASYNYEFGGLARKILRARPDTPRNSVTHWAQQLKAYWRKSRLNERMNLSNRKRTAIDSILSIPDDQLELETLKGFVKKVVTPYLEGGSRARRRSTRKRRGIKKQTRRRGSA